MILAKAECDADSRSAGVRSPTGIAAWTKVHLFVSGASAARGKATGTSACTRAPSTAASAAVWWVWRRMAPAAAAKTTSLIETAAPSAALAAFLIRLSRLSECSGTTTIFRRPPGGYATPAFRASAGAEIASCAS